MGMLYWRSNGLMLKSRPLGGCMGSLSERLTSVAAIGVPGMAFW
jgi:hypothetical protein